MTGPLTPRPREAAGREDWRPDSYLDEREWRGLDLQGVDATAARLLSCAVVDCQMDDAVLARTHVTDCEIVSVHATAVDAARGEWRDVSIADSRLGALGAHGSDWRRVTMWDARVDFLNLRGSRLAEVRFERCRFDEMHLGGAEADRVVMAGCRIGRLEVQGLTASEFDLRTSEIATVDDVTSLRGALMTHVQLVGLVPDTARRLGILLED